MKFGRVVAVSSLLVLLVALLVLFVWWEFGSPVSRSGLSELKANSTSSDRGTTVTIDGGLISSSLAVSGISQHRKGNCLVVIVRQAIVRQDRQSGRFHIEIAVPKGVDEIAFGNTHDVIWRRKQ